MILSLLAAATPTPTTGAVAEIAKGADAFWSMWGKPIGVLAVIVGAILLRVVIHFVIRRVVAQIVNGVKKKQNVEDTQALNSPLQAVRVVQRTRTLGSVLNNVSSVIIIVVAIAVILSVLDVNTVGIVSGASVIAAGLAFGAQNIVKDILSGMFIVLEDQLGVGDIVDVQLATGVVENVGIRVTQVRDVNGTLWFVRNGEILRVGNMSQGWARAIIDTAVPYDTDIDAVEQTILKVAEGLQQQPRWRTRVLEKPEIWGLQSISDSAMVIRLAVRTRSSEKDNVARELRVRLKKALDETGVTLPSLNSVVLQGFDEANSIKGARPVETAPTPVPRGRGAKGAQRPRISVPPPGAPGPQAPRGTTRDTPGDDEA
ncbi:mechanosensitive ion channel family protein [Frondihabitans peucedani]